MEASGRGRKGPGSSQEAMSGNNGSVGSRPGKVFHDESMYGIFRVERDRHGQAAWHVRLSRGGRAIQTTFSDATDGGYEPALTVARAYRDAVLKVVPPLTNRNMRMLVRKNRPNGSDIPGVYYKPADATHSAYWTAQIDVPVPGRVGANGRRKRKHIVRSFNIATHGYEKARQLAEEERMRMLLAVENGEDPALRNPAAVELHTKLADGSSSGSR